MNTETANTKLYEKMFEEQENSAAGCSVSRPRRY